MNKKNNAYLMCIIVFLQGLVFYGPVATLYRQSRGLSMFDIFSIESIFMVLMLIFEIPWGYFADRFGYKLTLIIANLLLFISKIVFYEAHSFPVFLLERVLMALAFSGISGCDIALLYSSIDENKSEKVFGLYTASSSAGYIAGSILATFMVSRSLDFTALCTIIPYGIAGLLVFFIKDVKPEVKEKSAIKIDIIGVFKNGRRILIIVLASALLGEVVHSIGAFLNQLQYVKSGIDIKLFGMLAALIQITSLLSARTHRITARFGQGKTIKVLWLCIFAGSVLLMITANPILSVFMIAVMQGSFSITQPVVLDIENKSISSLNRATILSMYAMGGDIASSLVNIGVGVFADISVEWALASCAVVSAAGFLLAVFYFRRRKNIMT